MATSGTEKTRIGASLSGVGKKLTITPKAAGTGGGLTVLDYERGIACGMKRGIARGMN